MSKRRKFWEFRAVTEPGVGELLLYGIIGSDSDLFSWFFDEITPRQFKEELDALGLGEGDTLRVYINSDGGDVFAGQAIHSMLARHPATVEVYVDGLAASIASVIAMAGDVIRMPRNAMMMIHAPWTIAMGNAEDFRELADTLDQVTESIIAAYQRKTDMSREEIIDLLRAETWMTAEEAVERGFADEIEEARQVAAAVRGTEMTVNGQRFDLSRFRNPPKPAQDESNPVASAGSEVTPGQLQHALAKALGLTLVDEKGPPQPPGEEAEPGADEERQRRLKMMAMELELLSGSSF